MATATLSGTLPDIYAATVAVFRENAFEKGDGLVFEKKGTVMDTVKYGGWSEQAVWVRMRVRVRQTAAYTHELECTAYFVSDRGDRTMEEEQKAWMSRRGECRKLVEQIQARLAAGTAPADR